MTEKHIHKLKRLRYKTGNTIFFCTLPDCTFKINTNLALGKRSLCWRCGQPFELDEYNLRLSKPHCQQCHVPKNGKPWIHEPSEDEKKAVIELAGVVRELSLAERLQKIVAKPAEQEEDGEI